MQTNKHNLNTGTYLVLPHPYYYYYFNLLAYASVLLTLLPHLTYSSSFTAD